MLFRAPPLVLRDEHFRDFDLAVNGNFEVFSISFADRRFAFAAHAGPRFLRDAETSKVDHGDKMFFEKTSSWLGKRRIAGRFSRA